MTVINIRLSENARNDTWRLLGTENACAANDLVRSLGKMAERLDIAALAWSEGDAEALADAAGEVGAEASALGLNRIARVARSIERLAHQDDPHALGANVARLLRLGQGLFEDVSKAGGRQG